jgi:hypothetical protein
MKALIALIVAAMPMVASAANFNCPGKVVAVMDYPSQCSGKMAFQTTGSNGQWICVPSETGQSIVLTAMTLGKSISVYIHNDTGSLTCANLPHYKEARYVLMSQ